MNKKQHGSEELDYQIAGHLASYWLPRGTARKVILFVFLILALKYFLRDDYLLVLLMLLLASFFSPRMVGELVNFVGKVARIINSFFKFFN